jgi:hypothetical protein
MNELDEQRHRDICAIALEVYRERDSIRQGLWKKYEAKDQLLQAKVKIERCLHALEEDVNTPEEVTREGPDIINYTIFAMRLVGEELRIRNGETV